MHATLKDWGNNWFGLELELNPTEIERLIARLQAIKSDPDQHFHISSDYKAESGLGDIEISVNQEGKPDNLFLSSLAMAPGDEI